DVRGEYVWVCDDDDLLLPDAVEPLIVALASATDAAWAFGRYRRFADTVDGPVDLDHGYWPDLTTGSLVRHILEDLFVRPSYRKRGYGKALIQALSRECIHLGCKRLEWNVLKWNTPSIDFYQSDVIGATRMEEWVGMRVDNEALEKLGQST
ncbi:MAG: hypothetical protein M1823_006587, partial [Watsoniomyces obsoletus]